MMMRLKPGSIKVEVIVQVAGDKGPVKAAIFHHAVELEALVMHVCMYVCMYVCMWNSRRW